MPFGAIGSLRGGFVITYGVLQNSLQGQVWRVRIKAADLGDVGSDEPLGLSALELVPSFSCK